ncbi:MAG: hypothetical protein SFU98_13620 [Leptospiraceae bacterium]|nr:hypothetical protein [Leptospiraceae bacterium]
MFSGKKLFNRIFTIIVVLFLLMSCSPIIKRNLLSLLGLFTSSRANTANSQILYSISITANGVNGTGFTLQNNAADDLNIPSDGNYTFSQRIAQDAQYSVTVKFYPTNQSCTFDKTTTGTMTTNVSLVISCTSVTNTPLYSTSNLWNSYIKNDGNSVLESTGTACAGSETDSRACIHAAVHQYITFPARSSCNGISASDNLTAFTWLCVLNPAGGIYIVSLNLGKRLTDLIDFSTLSFRPISIDIFENGNKIFTSTPKVFWTNQIINYTTGNLTVANAIYVSSVGLSINTTININANGISFVTNGLNVHTDTVSTMLSANSRNFIWVEGAFINNQATGGQNAIQLINVKFSVFQAIGLANFYNTNGIGINVTNVSNSIFREIIISNCKKGISLNSTSNFNSFYNIKVNNSSDNSVETDNANNGNIFQNVLTANQAFDGFSIGVNATSRNYLFNLTTSVSTDTGSNNYDINLIVGNLFHNTLSLNSVGSGFGLAFGNSSYVRNLATLGTTPNVNGNANTPFSGLLIQNNGVGCGASTQISASCDPLGASTHTKIDIAVGAEDSSFVGKITTNGTAGYSQFIDWFGFKNFYQFWGREDANTFPHPNHAGRCSSGNCRIFDISLKSTDTVLKNRLSCPTSIAPVEQIWNTTSSTSDSICSNTVFPGSRLFALNDCRSYYLANSIEILGDNLGNENGLCESNEQCVFTPNVGAYQGHGILKLASEVSGCADVVSNGVLSNIRLLQYETNGY